MPGQEVGKAPGRPATCRLQSRSGHSSKRHRAYSCIQSRVGRTYTEQSYTELSRTGLGRAALSRAELGWRRHGFPGKRGREGAWTTALGNAVLGREEAQAWKGQPFADRHAERTDKEQSTVQYRTEQDSAEQNTSEQSRAE